MAIKESENGKYIKIDKDRLFQCNGCIPVLIYKNEADRIANNFPMRAIVNLKVVPKEVDTGKDTIDNLITSMYTLMKTSKIKKAQITYIDTEPYKDWLDC